MHTSACATCIDCSCAGRHRTRGRPVSLKANPVDQLKKAAKKRQLDQVDCQTSGFCCIDINGLSHKPGSLKITQRHQKALVNETRTRSHPTTKLIQSLLSGTFRHHVVDPTLPCLPTNTWGCTQPLAGLAYDGIVPTLRGGGSAGDLATGRTGSEACSSIERSGSGLGEPSRRSTGGPRRRDQSMLFFLCVFFDVILVLGLKSQVEWPHHNALCFHRAASLSRWTPWAPRTPSVC